MLDMVHPDSDPKVEGFVLGFPVPQLRKHLTIPQHLGRMFSLREDLILIAANATTRGSIVDLHHDSGWVISTIPNGQCAKIFLLFPRTKHNLRQLKLFYRKSLLMEGNVHLLEGGAFYVQRGGSSIAIPSYTPHFVWTMKSCLLIGPEIWPDEEFPLRFENLDLDLAWYTYRQNGFTEYLENFTVRFERAVKHIPIEERESWLANVLSAWSLHADILSQYPKHSGRMWRAVTSTGRMQDCPCCCFGGSEVFEHFQRKHLVPAESDGPSIRATKTRSTGKCNPQPGSRVVKKTTRKRRSPRDL